MGWLSDGITFVWYGSVIGVLGAAGAMRILAPTRHRDVTLTRAWRDGAVRVARVCAPLLLLAVFVRLWLQTWSAFGSDQPLSMTLALIIINDTPWGTGWLWQMAAGVAVWLSLLRGGAASWPAFLPAAVAAGATVGLTGHAAGVDEGAGVLILAHGVHVIAAGLWLGTLAVILVVTRRAHGGDAAASREALARAIDRFSPQAVVAVSVLALSGLFAAWEHVGGIAALLTPYGFVFIAKLVAFGGAALCGLYNWRVVRPTLSTHPDGPLHLRSIASLELAFGTAALVLTSILTSMPMTHGGD